MERSSVADVDLLTPGAELHLNDAATLLLDALLFSEPAVVGHPLGEEGVLQFALRPNLFRAGNAGGDGNHEYVLWLGEGAAAVLPDLDALVAQTLKG